MDEDLDSLFAALIEQLIRLGHPGLPTYQEAAAEADLIFGRAREGGCSNYTSFISRRIPSLRKVGGYYIEPSGERFEHWWLEDADGRVYDPTVSQFEAGGRYERKII